MVKTLTWEAAIEYKRMLKEIQSILQKSEDFLNNRGIITPTEYIELENSEKIHFPFGYIRSVRYFEDSYQFRKYISDNTLRKNLCYSLQNLDVNSFFLDRIYIGLSVGKIQLKNSIILAYSIFEGIICGAADNLFEHCNRKDGLCSKTQKCRVYINSPTSANIITILERFNRVNILEIDKSGRDKVNNIKGLRDNIHLYIVKENELYHEGYTIENYNLIIRFLLYLKQNLPRNIENFKSIRSKNCKYKV